VEASAVKVLVADDEAVFRRLLRAALVPAGYELVEVADGVAAWDVMAAEEAPTLAVLDWVMPGLDGVEVCRRVRERQATVAPYLILLTAKDRTEDVVAGLEAGADDHIAKPFAPAELRARVAVGARVVTLQQSMAERVRALEEALAQVKALQGLLPMCAWCKKIRNDQNYWQQVETYIAERSDARFTHSICPDCRERVRRDRFTS
jgi:DNA-binding response OmpR family regulator